MQTLMPRPFGNTGLVVPVLGLGAVQIGDKEVSEKQVAQLLYGALDSGVTLIDTARGYSLSEERIGNILHKRRSEFILSTKVGYDVPGYQDWTGAAITAGIQAALKRLHTDVLDIVHFHSCPIDVLENSDVIPALLKAVEAGDVRVAAYSGDNEPLDWAIRSGYFASIQTSLNICDQRGITSIEEARRRGLGVIAKRPVANTPWRYNQRPAGEYVEVYWDRLQQMHLYPDPFSWAELALRFTAFMPGVDCSITGTADLDHLKENVAIVQQGPLPPEKVDEIHLAFIKHDQGWRQET